METSPSTCEDNTQIQVKILRKVWAEDWLPLPGEFLTSQEFGDVSNTMWSGSCLHISYTNFTFVSYFRRTLKLLTRAGQCPSYSGTNFVRSFTRDWTWAQCCTFRVTPWSRAIQIGHTRRWTITEWRHLTPLVRTELQTTEPFYEVQNESCV